MFSPIHDFTFAGSPISWGNPVPVATPGQDNTSHFRSTNGWHEWIGSRAFLCRCAAFFNLVSATSSSSGQVSCCSATSRELWTVGDFFGLPLNGFVLRSRLRTLLAAPKCTGQFSQAGPIHGTGTPLVPLVTRFCLPSPLPHCGFTVRHVCRQTLV